MMPALSPNTQAILLLTAPLINGRAASSPDLLSPNEYKRLAWHLRDIHHQPADLLSPEATNIVKACRPVIGEERLQRLLGRGFLLSQVIEHWQARAIWVLSRADAEYPRRLKARLREDAPAVLYGCGDMSLLETGGLAVVGSRHVNEVLIDYTRSVGHMAARAGRTIVSGGARGIDQAAMRGALEAGGKVCGVLADSLEKTAMNREHRNLLLNDQLVLISPYDPNAGFNVGNAMQRNKLIYGLADVSLVVSSDMNKGGTWAGAIEQLDKLKFVPVYVRSTGETSAGLSALRSKGALSWPNPQDVVSFNSLLESRHGPIAHRQANLALAKERPTDKEQATSAISESEQSIANPAACEPAASYDLEQVAEASSHTPADLLFATIREIIQKLLNTPMKEDEIAHILAVSKTQAKAWLQRLLEQGVIEKQKKTSSYVVKQKRLFE